MTTSNIISTPNITGDIGSCSINSTDIPVGTFYQHTIAVNSCTGHIVADSGNYFEGSWIAIPLIIISIIIGFFIGFKIID